MHVPELMIRLHESGLEPKRAVFVHPSVSAPPSLVLIEAKKGAGEGMIFSRPLIVFRDADNSLYTDDMRAVYDGFTLEHLFR